MTNGMYKVHFSAPKGSSGSGAIEVIDGSIAGGDGAFFYSGTSTVQGQTVKAQVRVRRHGATHLAAITGPSDSHELELVGTFTRDSFHLAGQVLGQPDSKIAIVGWRQA